jgi:hypothetical protein
MINMKQYTVTALLILNLIVGCATLSDMVRTNKFDETSDRFSRAMRWSNLEDAIRFRKDAQSGKIPSDRGMLKRVKITSYEIIQTIPLEDKTQIRQIAEIQYYKIDDVVVKTLLAHLLWGYDPIQKKWTITEGWPEFE